MKTIKLEDSEQEVIMFGNLVGVCRNLKWDDDKLISDPKANWYIDFLYINEDGWKDEDSPIEGGIGINTAKQLAEELNKAIKYLEAQEKATL